MVFKRPCSVILTGIIKSAITHDLKTQCVHNISEFCIAAPVVSNDCTSSILQMQITDFTGAQIL